jgi:hypothetical protein
MQRSTCYTSYLLRLWQMQNDQQTTWVASVQSTTTGELRSFPSTSALLEFLQAEFGGCEPTVFRPCTPPSASQPHFGSGENEP